MIQHRKDIDGLRAVAVLPVVLYHAGLGFPGGFVGVDVFFVISGYLITSLISEEMRVGHFSIVAFYERRMRRIFPALFAMMAVSTVAAWILFMPPEFILFGKSVFAAALFFSNFLFRKEAGYFDAVDLVKPLLHTWSLAVEEQFYILFPLLLLILKRWRSLQALAVLLFVIVSLAVSAWWVIDRPTDAFYLLPSRFWELGLGALLTYLPDYRSTRTATATTITAAGLCLIGIAIACFSSATTFPGLAALVPCIGAALVIVGGSVSNPASRLLSAPPLVFVGLISYSLYLWHWPLIVFAQYKLDHRFSTSEACWAVVVSLLVATASWKFIETPFRVRTLFRARPGLFAGSVLTMMAFCALGLTIKYFHGFPERLPKEALNIYAAKLDTSKYTTSDCFTDSKLSGPTDADVRAGHLCSVGNNNAAEISFAVWGDSHSGALTPGIGKAAEKYGRKGLLIGQGGCPPLLQYETKHPRQVNRVACIQRNEAALDLVRRAHIPLVFLVARWPREVLGAEYGVEGPYFDPNAPYQTEDRSAQVMAALDKTLAALAALHCRAVLVMDVPEPGYDVPYALARAANEHRVLDVNPPRSVVDQRQRQAINILKAAATKYGVELVDPTPSFCGTARCNAELDGRPLYVDEDHLTRSAAEALSSLFEHSLSVDKQAAAADVESRPWY